MKTYRMIPLVFIIASSSFAGFRIHSSLGGTTSFLGYNDTDSIGLVVREQNAAGFLLFGMAAEIDFRETLGLLVGIYSEDKGGTFKGDWLLWNDSYFELRYRYIQVPIHAKLIIPLLIPGSIFLSAGPELGFKVNHSLNVRLQDTTARIPFNIDSVTVSTDFGLSFLVGYEVPLGRYIALSLWAGYYHGFTDIYDNRTNPQSDYDLFNRVVKFGVSFITTVKEF
jgi:hypothetical protein